jgi:hypothetical protein
VLFPFFLHQVISIQVLRTQRNEEDKKGRGGKKKGKGGMVRKKKQRGKRVEAEKTGK